MGSKIKSNYFRYRVRFKSANQYIRILYVFNALSMLGSILYGLYYGVFLYRSTFSFSILAIDGLLGGLGVWLGYIIGVLVVKRFGYGYCLKIAFAQMALVSFLTAIVADNIVDWFMLLAVIKALPGGMFAAAVDTIMLREISTDARHDFLRTKLAFEYLSSTALPVLVGGMISLSGYHSVFVLSGLIYICALTIPLRLTRPELTLNIREIFETFKRPLYKRHAANRTIAAGFNQLNAFVVTVIPIIMLKNELQIGMLTSGVALMAGLISLYTNKVKTTQRLRLGYTAYTVRGMASLAFITVWSAPALMVWQLVCRLATPLHDPLQQSLDIHNDSLIMGRDLQRKALHINLLNNTLLLAGSTAAYGAFYLILNFSTHQQLVLQMLIIGFAVWRFINLYITSRINNIASAGQYG